jgi:hypothetical protein
VGKRRDPCGCARHRPRQRDDHLRTWRRQGLGRFLQRAYADSDANLEFHADVNLDTDCVAHAHVDLDTHSNAHLATWFNFDADVDGHGNSRVDVHTHTDSDTDTDLVTTWLKFNFYAHFYTDDRLTAIDRHADVYDTPGRRRWRWRRRQRRQQHVQAGHRNTNPHCDTSPLHFAIDQPADPNPRTNARRGGGCDAHSDCGADVYADADSGPD